MLTSQNFRRTPEYPRYTTISPTSEFGKLAVTRTEV
jgi:hypothetical protein